LSYGEPVHPIERLRYLARLEPSRVDVIAAEAADTLLACAADPAELVVACRRLLDRHPAAGPLWWVASSALTSADPHATLMAVMRTLDDDPTPLFVDAELAVNPDAVVVTAWSFGTDGVYSAPPEVADAEEAFAAGEAVVVAGGVARGLPGPVWRAAVARVERLASRRPALLDWACVTTVVGPEGLFTPAEAVAAASCPVAPELLGGRRS